MLVYKWVIKKDDKYYSLRNFGIDSGKIYNYKPYYIGASYITSCSVRKGFSDKIYNIYNGLTKFSGFHFWKKKSNKELNRWNKFLYRNDKPIINAILKCEIREQDIFKENDYQIVAKKFKVLEEISC